jgi:2-haloalkanoic acid dehalogenase type II
MAIVGRWPRAVFYDSKTTLFNWAGSWRGAAAQLLPKYGSPVPEQEFVETWVRTFEGLHRRAAFFRYTQVTDIVREALLTAYKIFGIRGSADDVEAFLELQEKVELFPDTEAALTDQQNLGVKVLIYSDVETKYLDMYVAKFKRFKADFVGTTEQAGVAKPNPRTYQWVLRKTGLEARDVLYCAAPMFDIQGAMSAGMIAAWLRRPEGRLSKETHTAGDLAADFEVENLHEVTRLVALNRQATTA